MRLIVSFEHKVSLTFPLSEIFVFPVSGLPGRLSPDAAHVRSVSSRACAGGESGVETFFFFLIPTKMNI